jgi:hypothetical protein
MFQLFHPAAGARGPAQPSTEKTSSSNQLIPMIIFWLRMARARSQRPRRPPEPQPWRDEQLIPKGGRRDITGKQRPAISAGDADGRPQEDAARLGLGEQATIDDPGDEK